MCRSRIIEIDKCATCPYLRYTITKDICTLNLKDNEIKDVTLIPNWCTLKLYPYYYGNSGMQDEYGNY